MLHTNSHESDVTQCIISSKALLSQSPIAMHSDDQVYCYVAAGLHVKRKKKKITSFGQSTSLTAHGRASATLGLPSIHVC